MKPTIATAALLLWASSVLAGQEYELKRQHEVKVGEREAFGARLVKDQQCRLKAGGKQVSSPTDEKLEIEIGGPRETLSVNKDGQEAQWRLIVKFCTFTRNGKTIPVFKTDDIIFSQEGETRQLVVNGSLPKEDQRFVLDMMFPATPDKGTPQENAAFLPAHKVKVGDTWPVNAELAKDIFAGIGAPIEKEAIHGVVTLESANPKDGLPCLQVSSEVSLDSKDIKELEKSVKYRGKKFFMIARQHSDYPVNPALPIMAERAQIHIEIESPCTVDTAGGKKDAISRLLISSEVSMAHLK